MSTTQASPWQASEQNIAKIEKERPGFIFRESAVPAYTLPDVRVTPDGRRVETIEDWERHARPQLIEQFERFVYGRSPKVPAGVTFQTVREEAGALGGRATHRRMRVGIPLPSGEPFTFEFSLFTPNGRPGKVPAFLLLNNRGVRAADPSREQKSEFWPVEALIDRGYASAVLQITSVQPDKPDGLSSGLVAALPASGEPDERWATLAAWAWAASRVLDALETVPQIDAKRVAVIGHSRGGKTALWAGATDPRFGLVVSNDSGCGGAALSRRPFGETVARINEVFPHWFCGNFKTFNGRPEKLPIDQHQLLALIAPRPLYIGCADDDLWADPRGEFIALAAASDVSRLYGGQAFTPSDLPPIDHSFVRGRLGYHVRSGGHDLTLFDWQQYLAFADAMWK